MSSSVPVERLFSYALMINLPKNKKLVYLTFERKFIVKTNMKRSVQETVKKYFIFSILNMLPHLQHNIVIIYMSGFR